MNKLITISLFSHLKKPYSIHRIFKQCHSTSRVTETVSNDQDRLRLGEEKYCDQISSLFDQPYKSVLETVYKETMDKLRNSHMMVSQVQAKTLHQLVRLLRPARVLEIGGFTGYSAIAMGSALLPNATLLSLELDNKHIAMARDHVKLANLQDKVQFKEGPAGDSLIDLVNRCPGTKYDFIFLDADKGGYINYFDTIMKYDLLCDHGVMIVDNVLFFGQVHKQAANYKEESDPANRVKISKNIKKTASKVDTFNQHVFNDPRVEVVVLPVFDGLSFIRKKVIQ